MYAFYIFCQAEELFEDMYKLDSNSKHNCFIHDTNFSSDLSIKQEPHSLTEQEMHAMAKDRQKKDNHNMSKLLNYLISVVMYIN